MPQRERFLFKDDPNAERKFWEGVVPLITLVATFALMGLRSMSDKSVREDVEYPVNMTEFRR